jgi:hypothetical protein
MPDQQTASALVEVGLGERERLVDANTRAPQHNDQTTHPPTVTTLSGLAHDRNDLGSKIDVASRWLVEEGQVVRALRGDLFVAADGKCARFLRTDTAPCRP